jgi:hypothetical protein
MERSKVEMVDRGAVGGTETLYAQFYRMTKV